MRPLSLFALAMLAFGCNTAKLTPAIDSGVDCTDPIPENPCVAISDGGTGCTGSLGSMPALGRDVIVDASYPAACTLIINRPVPDDDLQCVTIGTCHCEADGGAYSWVCLK